MSNQPTAEENLKNLTATSQAGLGVNRASLSALKSIDTQAKITNVQLAALNATNLDIARSSRRIASLQEEILGVASDQLNQQRRTNALLERQLEETNLEKLEKKRQLQLKQAAYAVGKQIDVLNNFKTLSKYILLRRMTVEVANVALNPDDLHEISDKEYAHTALTRLQESIDKANGELTESDAQKLQAILTSLESINKLPPELEQMEKEKDQKVQQLAHLRNMLEATKKKESGAGKKAKKIIGRILGSMMFLFAGLCLLGVKEQFGMSMGCFIFFGIFGLFLFSWGKSNKKQIEQLQKEILVLEDKINGLAMEYEGINTRLQQSQRVIGEITREYPELKELFIAIPPESIADSETASIEKVMSVIMAGKKDEAVKTLQSLIGGTIETNNKNVKFLEISRLADAGEKIEAVKKYQEMTGCGLAEAKESVEALKPGAALNAMKEAMIHNSSSK